MTNYLTFQTNNSEFNPLFEKMKDRFCRNGTIAEQLKQRANEYKKSKPRRVSAEFHMTHANSLPKNTVKKNRKAGHKRGFFTLTNINSACMLLLVAGTVLFSGAAIGTFKGEVNTSAVFLKQNGVNEEGLILTDAIPSEATDSISFYEELAFSL
jgi:hypothetical protein